MGMQHLFIDPVQQGEEKMGCWAASMEWWLKAVRKVNMSMHAIAIMYEAYTSVPPEECAIGGLTDRGVKRMFEDYQWSIWYTWEKRWNISPGLVDSYLSDSPAFISYYDPELRGAHMNVIVAKIPFTESRYWVMDPSFPTLQPRYLNYYTEKSENVVLASARTN